MWIDDINELLSSRQFARLNELESSPYVGCLTQLDERNLDYHMDHSGIAKLVGFIVEHPGVPIDRIQEPLK